ncbi:hypothetical protein [Paracoccus pacificus]|uniref:Uncharacterized protein n=1 Tax=Paracoccus pacificus TaxID=1463598 RepID=A0ABW4R7F0_9RHOB
MIALTFVLGLTACAESGPGVLFPNAAPDGPEALLLARTPGGAWADPAPLATLQASGSASCASTDKGTACVLRAAGTNGNQSLATARDGRCVANWGGGTNGTGVATVALHRNAFPTTRDPRRETLFYPLNSGRPLDATPRMADAAAFTRFCDQLLQPDRVMTQVHEW